MVSLKKSLSDNHRRASKMLALALHADNSDIWIDAPIVWRARLTEAEVVAIAHSALRALDNDHCTMVCAAVLGSSKTPMVPLLSEMDEAAHWADFADYPTVKACILAGYNRLGLADQTAFLNHVTSQVAA